MPKVTVSKESLEGKTSKLTGGIYHFRVDGFKPKKASKGNSTNLQPQLKVINHSEFNDEQIYENLNSQAGWVQRDFCHSLGIKMEGADETELPGEFMGPPDDPSQWKYVGKITGKVGKCELHTVPAKDKQGNLTGKMRTEVKRYICAIPGCQVNHRDLN